MSGYLQDEFPALNRLADNSLSSEVQRQEVWRALTELWALRIRVAELTEINEQMEMIILEAARARRKPPVGPIHQVYDADTDTMAVYDPQTGTWETVHPQDWPETVKWLGTVKWMGPVAEYEANKVEIHRQLAEEAARRFRGVGMAPDPPELDTNTLKEEE